MPSARILLWPLAAAAVAPVDSVAAQERAITQYQIETWGSEQGLPGNTIQTIRQSADGYLWIATQDGLARFDGVRFVAFTKQTTRAITSNDIADLAIAGDAIWLGINGGGVLRYAGGRFTTLNTRDGLSNDAVATLQLDRAGTLWVGTAGGLNRVRAQRVETIGAPLSGAFVRALAQERNGGMWVGTERAGLFLVRDDSIISPAGARALAGESIRALVDEGRNGLWIGTSRGLFLLRDGTLDEPLARTAVGSAHEVRALLRGRDGALWIGTADAGLLRLRNGDVESLTAANGLPSGIVNTLFEDREGNMWVGTAGGGVAVLRQGPFIPVTKREGLAADVALPIMQTRDGSIWIGTFGGGLSRFRDGRLTTHAAREGLASPYVMALAEGRDSTLWIGTRAGLELRRNGRIRRYRAVDGAVGGPVISLLTGRSGTLWVGTTSGLFRIRNDSVTSFTTDDGLPNNFIHALHEDRGGNLWIGTNGGGLARMRGDRFETFTTAHGLGSDVVINMHEGSDGTLWIATTASLTRLRNGRFANIRAQHGLHDDKLSRILEDDAGNLWMSSNRGVFRVARAELNAVADGKAATVTSTVFTEKDGLPSSEANGGIQPAGWKDRRGRLWFPTMKGAAYVDPAKLAAAAVPFPVLIEHVRANDREIAATGAPLELPPGSRRLELAYTALSFVAPARIAFQYRLAGFDEDWIDAGTRRTASYTNLPPGAYSFHVRARHPGGAWNAARAPMSLTLRAHFHETAAFRILLLLAVAGTLVALERWRAAMHRSRERELLALVEERRRAENRYRGLFEGANDIVFTADLDGRITSLNQRGKLALGVSDPLPDDLTLREIVSPDSLPVFDVPRSEAQSPSPGASAHEITLQTPAGAIAGEATVQLMREGEQVTGVQGIVRDITERRNLEAKLRQSEKLEAVGQLAGGIAHDFNNLLSVIKSTADLLREDLGATHASQADVSEIDNAADRAAQLTQQLLAFSRNQVLSPEVVNLNDLVREVERLLSRTIRENIELRTFLAEDLYNIEVDPTQIHQVLMNLAVNARDAMQSGGVLTISTFNEIVSEADAFRNAHQVPAGRYACLRVRDTGTGMDARTREQIFEPFFTTKDAGKGAGLGLATVYGIIKQSGGYIWVDSEPGKGTRFTIYLPESSRERATAATHTLPRPQPVHGETILVVEDDAALRRTLCRILERAGYKVLAAAQAREALDLLNRHRDQVDLVLTDVIMPGMSGTEMAELMLQRSPKLKVLFSSGYTEGEVAEYGAIHAGVSFIQKPAAPDVLRARVRELLDSREDSP